MKSPYIAAEVQITTIPVKWGCATEYRLWSGSPSKNISKKILGVCENRETEHIQRSDYVWPWVMVHLHFVHFLYTHIWLYLKLHFTILLWCCDKQQTGSQQNKFFTITAHLCCRVQPSVLQLNKTYPSSYDKCVNTVFWDALPLSLRTLNPARTTYPIIFLNSKLI